MLKLRDTEFCRFSCRDCHNAVSRTNCMTKIPPDINEKIVNDEIRWHGISLLE